MPVVGHDAIGEHPRAEARAGLFQHGFEGFVVAVPGKDAQAGVSAIQDMVNQSPGIDSHGASHGGILAAHRAADYGKRFLTPFLRPLTPLVLMPVVRFTQVPDAVWVKVVFELNVELESPSRSRVQLL